MTEGVGVTLSKPSPYRGPLHFLGTIPRACEGSGDLSLVVSDSRTQLFLKDVKDVLSMPLQKTPKLPIALDLLRQLDFIQ